MNKLTPLTIVGGLLILGVPATAAGDDEQAAKAESERATCSNKSLHGDYIGHVEGLIVPGSVPIIGVGISHFDGKGNLSEVGHVVINGTPTSATVWGPPTTGSTYQINSDCTGTVHIIDSNNGDFFLNLAIVVLKNGKQAFAVVTAPYFAPLVMSHFTYVKNE